MTGEAAKTDQLTPPSLRSTGEQKTVTDWNAEIARIVKQVADQSAARQADGSPLASETAVSTADAPVGAGTSESPASSVAQAPMAIAEAPGLPQPGEVPFEQLPPDEQEERIGQLKQEAETNPQKRKEIEATLREMRTVLIDSRINLIEEAVKWVIKYGGGKRREDLTNQQLVELGYRIYLTRRYLGEPNAPRTALSKLTGTLQPDLRPPAEQTTTK